MYFFCSSPLSQTIKNYIVGGLGQTNLVKSRLEILQLDDLLEWDLLLRESTLKPLSCLCVAVVYQDGLIKVLLDKAGRWQYQVVPALVFVSSQKVPMFKNNVEKANLLVKDLPHAVSGCRSVPIRGSMGTFSDALIISVCFLRLEALPSWWNDFSDDLLPHMTASGF